MNTGRGKLRQAHMPERTCIVCRQAKYKPDLVRIVITENNKVVVDSSGKLSGRGTYLCKSKACWDGGLKKNRLDRSLRTIISDEDKQDLARYGEMLPG